MYDKDKSQKRFFMRFIILAIILSILPIFPHTAKAQERGMSDTLRLPGSVEAITSGKALFNNHCGICHAVTHEIVGPSLASVPQKRPLTWLVQFIRNSQQVIREGDEYSVELYHNYNRLIMPPFEFLSDSQILSILAYIQDASIPERVQAESQYEPFEQTAHQGRTSGNFSRSLSMKSFQTDMGAPLYLTTLYITLIISLVVVVWLGIRIFKNTH